MTNQEQLDEARAKEAERLWESFRDGGVSSPSIVAARLARENWTPPEPVVDPDLLDPDVLAWREWVSRQHPLLLPHNVDFSHLKNAYLAGARMAREREQERAKVLEAFVKSRAVLTLAAAEALAKYRGEA